MLLRALTETKVSATRVKFALEQDLWGAVNLDGIVEMEARG